MTYRNEGGSDQLAPDLARLFTEIDRPGQILLQIALHAITSAAAPLPTSMKLPDYQLLQWLEIHALELKDVERHYLIIAAGVTRAIQEPDSGHTLGEVLMWRSQEQVRNLISTFATPAIGDRALFEDASLAFFQQYLSIMEKAWQEQPSLEDWREGLGS